MKPRIWELVRSYKFNSIFVRTYLLILALVVLPLAGVMFYTARYFERVATSQVIGVNELEADQVRASFDQLVTQIYQLIADMGTNHRILGFMTAEAGSLSSEDRFFLYQQVDEELLHQFRIMPIVNTVNLVSFGNDLIISSDRGLRAIGTAGEIEALSAELDLWSGRVGWFSLRTSTYPFEDRRLTLYWRLPPHTDERLGVVYIEFETDGLKRVLSVGDAHDYSILLVDQNERILYASDAALVGTRLSSHGVAATEAGVSGASRLAEWDGAKAIVSRSSSRFGVDILGIRPLATLNSQFAGGRTQILGVIAAFALIGVVVAFYIASRAYQPVARLLDLVDNLDEPSDLGAGAARHDEVRYISNAIGDMVSSRREVSLELERRLTSLRRAQQIALRSQINPHFLYNTLETIRWKAMGMTRGENGTSVMITQLSKLLRISLETAEELVTLETEVQYGKLYMDLQQVRYGEQFALAWVVPNELLSARVPRFTLQPLLENALYHGVKPVERFCTITVQAERGGSSLILSVVDNGAGLDASTCKAINRELEAEADIHGTHIGLRNINQRIRLVLGNDYGLRLDSLETGGTVVTVTLPLDLRQGQK